MMANVTYILNPYMVSNTNFYVPIILILALSPFIIWLITIFFIRNSKLRFFIDIINLIYTLFLMTTLLPSLLGYYLTQIYQIINAINDSSLALQLYNLENELVAIYSIVSTFSLFYYAMGIILLVADTSSLWT
jgi:signal transduction histidine kinase